jgi:NTP pyrophosphatase (non-canonical NTP hydrolase)
MDSADVEKAHTEMVLALAKPGEDVLASLTPEKAHLWHMITGLSGEVGELLDSIKKHVIYNKELDIGNVVEEKGDIEFYLKGLRTALNITREEVLRHNLLKLAKRYGGKYSDSAAQARADKA